MRLLAVSETRNLFLYPSFVLLNHYKIISPQLMPKVTLQLHQLYLQTDPLLNTQQPSQESKYKQ